MRLRNIPRAEGVLKECKEVVKNAPLHKNGWHLVFGIDHPLHIEIGMGKGQFLMKLAGQNPDINYIGIERYKSVLLRAVEKFKEMEAAEECRLKNIRFICMDAAEIGDVFGRGEVHRIYLNFSDPWPKARHARRRLTSKEYFARYDQVLSKTGSVEFKTDNTGLFEFSLAEIGESDQWAVSEYTHDLHSDGKLGQGNVLTEYEEKFSSMGNPICKLTAIRKS